MGRPQIVHRRLPCAAGWNSIAAPFLIAARMPPTTVQSTPARRPSSALIRREAVVQRMRELHASAASLAQQAGVGVRLLDDWLAGYAFPRPDKLLRLAMSLRLGYTELVDDSDEEAPMIEFGEGPRSVSEDKVIGDPEGMAMLLRAMVPYLPPERPGRVGTGRLRTVMVPVLWGAEPRTEKTLRITWPVEAVCFSFLNLDKAPDLSSAISVSSSLWGAVAPTASEYIAVAEQTYSSEFFTALRAMVREHGYGHSYVRQVMGVGLIDGMSIHQALLQGA